LFRRPSCGRCGPARGDLSVDFARQPPRTAHRYILLALTGTLIWGRLFLEVIAPTTLLRLDARFVSLLSGMPSEGNVVNFSGGGPIPIAPGCSSLHNMSLAVLMWITAVKLLDLTMTRRVLATGLLASWPCYWSTGSDYLPSPYFLPISIFYTSDSALICSAGPVSSSVAWRFSWHPACPARLD